LSHSLGFRISDIEQHADETGATLNQTVNDILGSDDKMLSGLQKLGWELDHQDPDEARTVDKLREVCMRLVTVLRMTWYDTKSVQINKEYRRDAPYKVG
jgi:hypothetical protein